jgi:hypothetical protein
MFVLGRIIVIQMDPYERRKSNAIFRIENDSPDNSDNV